MADAELTLYIDDWRGYSAYEIATQHGFTGTEAQWMASLRGEPGQDAEAVTVNGVQHEDGNIALTAEDIPVGAGNTQSVAETLDAIGGPIADADIDAMLAQ